MQINPELYEAELDIRLLSKKEAAERMDIPLATLYQILGWRGRRDENGLVNINPETGRKLRRLLEEVEPVISLVRAPQGPRRLPADLPVDMKTSPEDHIRAFHRARKAKVT